MLSLKKCREILDGDSPDSDKELELLRDHLYGLARVVVEACPCQRRGNGAPDAARRPIDDAASVHPSKPPGFPGPLAMLREEDRYDVEERAAIMEFDGGLDRAAAERAAFSFYWRDRRDGH